jgi:hypothetical protein
MRRLRSFVIVVMTIAVIALCAYVLVVGRESADLVHRRAPGRVFESRAIPIRRHTHPEECMSPAQPTTVSDPDNVSPAGQPDGPAFRWDGRETFDQNARGVGFVVWLTSAGATKPAYPSSSRRRSGVPTFADLARDRLQRTFVGTFFASRDEQDRPCGTLQSAASSGCADDDSAM